MKLVIARGEFKGKEFPLEEGENLIGRWDPDTGAFPEVDLEEVDTEAKISRKHALVVCREGKVSIEDLDSLNGTFLNRGERLEPGATMPLKSGDEVIVGKTFLRFED